MQGSQFCNLGFGAAGFWFGLLGFWGGYLKSIWGGWEERDVGGSCGLGIFFFAYVTWNFSSSFPFITYWHIFFSFLFTGAQKAQTKDVIYGNT